MKLSSAASLALHAALLSVFLIGSRFGPREMPGLGPGDFTPVSLVGPEVLSPAPAKAPAKPAPRETKPEPVKPVVPELKPEKDEGIKLPDTPKKKPQKTPADSARAQAPPAPSPPPAPAPAAQGPAEAALAGVPEAVAGDGATVAAGVEGGEGGGGGFGEFAYYRIAMQNKIAANWSPAFVSGEAVCVVYFRIIRSGMVVGARVEEPSGIPYYDQTALRAVLESSPLPPLPAQFPDDAVGVHFRFRYKPS